MPKVSIIVPVYNVEKYLSTCLDSLINQTLKDIEIICVNDGSTDNSLNILNEYAQKDTRIIVINKENSGPGSCRNLGIEKATGEYIQFVDSDDWIMTETCEVSYKKAIEYNVDMVSFNANKICNKKCFPIYYYDIKEEKLVNWIDIADKLFKFPFHSCHYLIKRDFLLKNNIRYPENIFWCEDVLFILKCWLDTKDVYVTTNPLYNYIQHKNSTTQNNTHFFDLFKLIPSLKELVRSSNNNILKNELSLWIVKHFNWIVANKRNKNTLEKIKHFSQENDCMTEYQCLLNQIKTLDRTFLNVKLFGKFSMLSVRKKKNKLRVRFFGLPLFSIKQKKN